MIDGEAYFTLGSKESWGFKQIHWPLVDENTRIIILKPYGEEYVRLCEDIL